MKLGPRERVALFRQQVLERVRPAPAPVPKRDRTPTAPIPPVGVVREIRPRTQPLPRATRYPDPLPPELERVADAFTLAAQGRLSPIGLMDALNANVGVWYARMPSGRSVHAAVRYLARWDSFYAELLEGDCSGPRCADQQMCPTHRKTLRQWQDRLHPVVRAAADPQSFEATVAPLLKDVPTTTRST